MGAPKIELTTGNQIEPTVDLTTLAKASQQGDKSAYEKLIRTVIAELRRYVAKRLFDTNDLDDVVQDLVLKVHINLWLYDSKKKFEPWLFTLARNGILDHLKKRMVRIELRGQESIDELPGEITEYASAARELDAIFSKLPNDQKEALELTKFAGLTLIEAAEATGININTFKARVSRATNNLVRLVKVGGDDNG